MRSNISVEFDRIYGSDCELSRPLYDPMQCKLQNHLGVWAYFIVNNKSDTGNKFEYCIFIYYHLFPLYDTGTCTDGVYIFEKCRSYCYMRYESQMGYMKAQKF